MCLSQLLLHGTYNSIYNQMEYKKMLHKMQDNKNRKGNKCFLFRLFVLFLTKKILVS